MDSDVRGTLPDMNYRAFKPRHNDPDEWDKCAATWKLWHDEGRIIYRTESRIRPGEETK